MTRCILTFFALRLCNVYGEEVTFSRDIRPILSDNCYSCHGTDAAKRKAGLRLDTFEGATADSDGIRAILPGELRNPNSGGASQARTKRK